MPTRLTWDADNPEITRHGFTDFLKTNKGWRAIRVFDGRGQGRFRVTTIGKRYYGANTTLNQYVVQLPALFRTYKGGVDAPPVEHRYFFLSTRYQSPSGGVWTRFSTLSPVRRH